MLAKLLVAASFLFLLICVTACGLDITDEPRTPGDTISHAEPVSEVSSGADPAPSPTQAQPPAGSLVPVATPQPPRAIRPVEVPSGSAGHTVVRQDGVTYDEACLDMVFGEEEPEPDATFRLSSPYIAPGDRVSSFAPVPLEQDPALREALLAALGSDANRYAFVVKDLSTGYGAVHNAEVPFNAASLFKLFVMYEVFVQQSLGHFDWLDQLVITPYYDGFALSPRITALCQALSVSEALTAMMTISDNAAAVLLQDLVGAGNVNAGIELIGLTQSGLFTEGLPVTAADLALLLEAIATGQAVSVEASADMVQLMTGEGIDNGLISGLPGPAIVAHKTGNWNDATHDAGIVFTDFGAYVFVVLSQTSHETRGIQALSKAAYEYFEGRAR